MKRFTTLTMAVALAVLAGTALVGCRPYTGSTPMWAPGYRCRGKVGIAAPSSGADEVRGVFPSSGDQTCVASDGYRATASMRVMTKANPTGYVVNLPIGPEFRYRYTNVTKVRFRLQYRTGCDTAVVDVDAGTATHDPIACS